MSINLTNAFIIGANKTGQWIPDFACDAGCGNGVYLGPNDCQCLNGYEIDSKSNLCSQTYFQNVDSIVINLPATLFLLTREYERFIAQAVASSLNLNFTQIKTVEYSGNEEIVRFQFIIFADSSLESVILDEELKTLSNKLSLPSLQPLSMELIVLARDWIRPNEPVGLILYVLLAILVAALLANIALRIRNGFLNTSENQNLDGNNKVFSWLTHGFMYIGVILAIAASLVHLNQPSDVLCRSRSWFLFLSLSFIVNVYVARLYRLCCIFNNPNYSKVLFSEMRLFLVFVLPLTLLTVLFLILGELQSPTMAELETLSDIARERSWTCVNDSFLNKISILCLISLHLFISLTGVVMRYIARHIPHQYLDHVLFNFVLFIIVPFSATSVWYLAQNDISLAPRVSAIVAILWVQLYSLFVVFMDIYNLLKKQVQMTVISHNFSNLKSNNQHRWSGFEVSNSCLATLINDDFCPCYIKILTVARLPIIGLFTKDEDWTGMYFCATNICRVMVINEKTQLLRIFTNNQRICTIQMQEKPLFDVVLKMLNKIVESKAKSKSENQSESKAKSKSENI